MSYELRFTPAARRALARLPLPVAMAAAELIYGDLRATPQRVGKPLGPPLDGQHSARRGQYRIRYRIEPDVIVVLDVAHRHDAYR